MRSNDNYDPSELEKFSEFANHWWDQEGELKALHQLNPLRLSYIKQKTALSGKRILDVGCGGGILSEALDIEGAEVTGIDLTQKVIEVAKLHQMESKSRVTYLCESVENLANQSPAHFDIITCLEMLEHVPDPASIIEASATLLKPGGLFFFSTLNRNPKSYLMAIIGAELVLNLLPRNTHDYAKFIKPSELSEWMRPVNLSIADLVGVSYNLLTKTFSLSKDLSVNYMGVAKKGG